MTSRIYTVRLNLDEMAAGLAHLGTDKQRSAWLRGFQAGSRGFPSEGPEGSPAAIGHALGFACYEDARALQEVKSSAGQASAAARQAAKGTAQPQRNPEQAANGIPSSARTGVRTERRTNDRAAPEPIEISSKPGIQEASQPPASAPAVPRGTPDPDPRLAAAAACGAYLTLHGESLREDWLVAVQDLDAAGVTAVYDRHRAAAPLDPLRMPSSFLSARRAHAAEDQRAKQAQAVAAEKSHNAALIAADEDRKRADALAKTDALRARAKRVLDHCATEPGWDSVQDALCIAVAGNAITLQRALDQLPPALRKIADTVPQEASA